MRRAKFANPGVLALMGGFLDLFAVPLAALFYVPALVVANRTLATLDRSGTDRVKGAIRALDHAIWMAYGCILSVLLLSAFYWWLRLM